MLSEQDVIICRCEEVTAKVIKESIRDGAQTIDAVKRYTRAGMGLCQGRTCNRLVAQLLVKEKGLDIAQTAASSRRPPVRPIALGILASEEE
jgi:NAD(P)H-nitrite reductase large subunit